MCEYFLLIGQHLRDFMNIWEISAKICQLYWLYDVLIFGRFQRKKGHFWYMRNGYILGRFRWKLVIFIACITCSFLGDFVEKKNSFGTSKMVTYLRDFGKKLSSLLPVWRVQFWEISAKKITLFELHKWSHIWEISAKNCCLCWLYYVFILGDFDEKRNIFSPSQIVTSGHQSKTTFVLLNYSGPRIHKIPGLCVSWAGR